jgi:hypothetical protein
MNVPLIVAGSLAILGAAIHGVAGELLIVRRIQPQMLPPSRFGGPAATKSLLQASWHLVTIAFLTMGCALLAAGSVVDGEAARAIGIVAASAFTGFAALVVGAACVRGPRRLFRHPAPALLTAVAALAWWGAL